MSNQLSSPFPYTPTLPLPAGEHAPEERAHVQQFIEIEGLDTADDALYASVRAVVSALEPRTASLPDPADDDTKAIAIQAVETLAAVYGLLADAEHGVMYVTDRDGLLWVIGPAQGQIGIVATAWIHDAKTVLPLRDLVAQHGPITIGKSLPTQHFAIPPVRQIMLAAHQLASLLLLHGLRVTASDWDKDVIWIWNPGADTDKAWSQHVIDILTTEGFQARHADEVDDGSQGVHVAYPFATR